MKCGDILPLLMIILIVIISYRMVQNSDYFQLTCVVSHVDGNRYCVRERKKIKAAANLLAKANHNMNQVVEYCKKNYKDQENVKRLVKGYNPKKIVEILPTSTLTAYSENKGEKIAFCLAKSKRDDSELIDLNTLTFVALHELAHVATESIGHTPEYWNNFKFLLVQAEKINIYKPIDYSKKHKKYCGMSITHNPFYD